jgi:N-acyl-D-aspartate/D-glutamate deacylase
VFEMITDMVDLDADFALFRAMAEVSGRPLSISTAQRMGFPADEYLRVLARLEEAVADGIELRGQVAPRPVAIILNLEGSGNPLLPSPTYQGLASLALAERVVELRRPEQRDRILAELAALPPGKGILDRYDMAFPLSDPPRYDLPVEQSIGAEAARRGVAKVEIAYDLLLAEEGKGMILVPASNYLEGNLNAVRDMVVHPLTVPGLGDAGAHCTMVCDASFPTHLLAYWGLQAPEDRRLPLEWIVKRQCADSAELLGMHDRGVLAPGYRADVNVIDLDQLAVGKLEMLYDLPAGGKRLVQRGTGYVTTLVRGEVVSRDGEFTGALPGGVVRGPQTQPA